jgi:hypothetical protein
VAYAARRPPLWFTNKHILDTTDTACAWTTTPYLFRRYLQRCLYLYISLSVLSPWRTDLIRLLNHTHSFTCLLFPLGSLSDSSRPIIATVVKDKCPRPTPTYNNNYDPDEVPCDNLHKGYSPYVKGEPLYNDRPVVRDRLPARHRVAGPAKRLRTQWVWH